MKQPPGFEDGTDNVCKLVRTLYRLKQSGWIWSQELGYKQLFSDQCVYHRMIREEVLIIAVHVDDNTIFASSDATATRAKDEIRRYWKITDMGTATQIVGFEIERDWEAGTLKITQKQYINKVLNQFGMEKSHPVGMPLDLNVILTKLTDGKTYEFPDYQMLIGSLM